MTETNRGFAQVLTGNLASAASTLLTFIILARVLGPTDLGRFALGYAVMLLVSHLSDLGLSTALVRYGAARLDAQDPSTMGLPRTVFLLKAVLGIGGGILVLVATPLAPEHLLLPLLAAAMAVPMMALATTLQATVQAEERFDLHLWSQVSGAGARVLFVVALLISGTLELWSVVWVLPLTPFCSAVPLYRLRAKLLLQAPPLPLHQVTRLFRFGRWVAVTFVLASITAQLDSLLLEALSSSTQLGYYAAAATVPAGVRVVTSSLTTALLPRAARSTRTGPYVRSSLRLTLPIAAVLALLAPLREPIVMLLYGPEFGGAVLPFLYLLIAALITIVANPIGLLLLARDRPHWVALQASIQLLLNIVLDIYTIPRWGAAGASFTTMVVMTAGLAFIVTAVALLPHGSDGE